MTTNKKSFDKEVKADNRKKITIKTSTAKSLGLFSMIGVIMGAMIGVGIFFKNKSVFENNNNNPTGVLISWGIVLLLTLATAMSYCEIVKCKTKSGNSGLAGWCERYVGYNFGRFVKIAQPLFYYSIFIWGMPIFVTEAIFNINPNYAGTSSGITANFWYLILVTMVISSMIIVVNMFTESFTTKLSGCVTIIKFLPLTTVIIFGIIIGAQNPDSSFFNSTSSVNESQSGHISFSGILDSLPAIMFAFDSFLIVGNIAKNAKKPTTDIPLSMLITIILSGSFYILITIGQLLAGTADPYEVIKILISGETAQLTVKIIFSILLAIVVFGGANAIMLGGCRSLQSAIDEEILLGSKSIRKMSNGRGGSCFAGGFVALIIILIGFFVLYLPSGILQTDALVDGMTNIAIVFFFAIYAIPPIFSVINRKTNRVPESEVERQKIQIPAAIIGSFGCLFVAGYSMFYQFGYRAINEWGEAGNLHWGLFYNNAYSINLTYGGIIFWSVIMLFIIIPFMHDALIKATNNNYSQKLLWERKRNNV